MAPIFQTKPSYSLLHAETYFAFYICDLFKGKHVAQPLIPDLCSERTHFDSTNLQATLKKINFIAFLSLTRRLLSQEHFLKIITHHSFSTIHLTRSYMPCVNKQ
jgi:hypothetical protein